MQSGWRERALDYLATLPGPRAWLWIGLAIALVTSLDWFSHAQIAASLGYLLPISLAAWSLGRMGAIVTAAVCAGLWLTVDLVAGPSDALPAIGVVNLVVLTVAFQLFGLLLATLREQLDFERRMAQTDPLTRLQNRRACSVAIAREIERGRRQGQPFSLAYVDVDGFKGVNDRFGHRAGDELLRRIAHALQQDLRQLDVVARLGGDEFVLLLPGTGVVGAGKVLARLRKRLAKAAWRQAFEVDFSIGCLTVLDGAGDVETVLARADDLMYAVKHSGRGQIKQGVMPAAEQRSPAGAFAASRSSLSRRSEPPTRLAT